jgi:hypothetical protein
MKITESVLNVMLVYLPPDLTPTSWKTEDRRELIEQDDQPGTCWGKKRLILKLQQLLTVKN